MLKIKDKFINIIENLPYDIDKELLKKDVKEILEDVVKRYVETYGIEDLSEKDKECIKEILKVSEEE